MFARNFGPNFLLGLLDRQTDQDKQNNGAVQASMLKVFYQVFHLPLTMLSIMLTGISSISWLRTIFLMPTKILPSNDYQKFLKYIYSITFQIYP